MNPLHRLSLVAGHGLLVLAALSTAARADLVQLHSGSGPVGGLDPNVTVLEGPANADFPFFSGWEFAAAAAGPPAWIINPNPSWPASIGYPDTRWISTSPTGDAEGSSGLYCQEFMLPQTTFLSATLDFHFSVDNTLGAFHVGPEFNYGLYLNGQPVPSTQGGNFFGVFGFVGISVADLLQPGLNRFYVNVVDVGGPSGVIYWADLTFAPGESVASAVEAPSAFALARNYPNPFNPTTTIDFSVEATSDVRLTVSNLSGETVATLVDGTVESGAHSVQFDAARLTSGVYFYTLASAGASETRKMVLVK